MKKEYISPAVILFTVEIPDVIMASPESFSSHINEPDPTFDPIIDPDPNDENIWG